MSQPDIFNNSRERLFIPALGPFYDKFAQPIGWSVLRIAMGLSLAYAGWPKIQNPFAMTGFVESIGFAPGWLFSPLLAGILFFGGLLLAAGLFTRPVALACGVAILVTLYYHIIAPYPPVFLTAEGIEALTANPEYFTPGAAYHLKDGGAAFLAMAQSKALTNSFYWAGGILLFAAFGGGYFSLDQLIKKKF
ncbi:DoxX family protein [uncultured Cohaesibacter sp.]|uniref:DoxX family protein n=1 Tax=uncultured Cohaesibacter sp. TaxID=1002546 RepID=UPI0029C819E2|nr:DoxX family protein [uncultured Cohaesibacter sp.]